MVDCHGEKTTKNFDSHERWQNYFIFWWPWPTYWHDNSVLKHELNVLGE